jgi:hypothetical protein
MLQKIHESAIRPTFEVQVNAGYAVRQLRNHGAPWRPEVYRAKDTGLGRQVAIKTILLDFQSQPDALMRFEQSEMALGLTFR